MEACIDCCVKFWFPDDDGTDYDPHSITDRRAFLNEMLNDDIDYEPRYSIKLMWAQGELAKKLRKLLSNGEIVKLSSDYETDGLLAACLRELKLSSIKNSPRQTESVIEPIDKDQFKFTYQTTGTLPITQLFAPVEDIK